MSEFWRVVVSPEMLGICTVGFICAWAGWMGHEVFRTGRELEAYFRGVEDGKR